MTTSELVQLGTQLVDDATARNITLRMLGGVAIYARCPSIASNTRLQRENKDLDFVVAADAWQTIGEVFTARGFTKQDQTTTEQHYVQNGVTLEVTPPHLHEDHNLDFTARLATTPLTLPLAELLLIKLARKKFQVKDIQDSTALFVDHRVTDAGGDEEDEINRTQLYHTVNANYPLWKTVFDNTVTLEKIFNEYLDPEEAQLAWRRIELIQEVLDGKSHTVSWWAGRVLTP